MFTMYGRDGRWIIFLSVVGSPVEFCFSFILVKAGYCRIYSALVFKQMFLMLRFTQSKLDVKVSFVNTVMPAYSDGLACFRNHVAKVRKSGKR